MINVDLNNSIVLCPRELYGQFFSYRRKNPLVNFKLMTLEEALSSFSYQYDDQAILYLVKENFTYQLAVDSLKSLQFLDKNAYSTKKLNDLVLIRDELLKADLLWKTDYPSKDYENKKVHVFGYEGLKELERFIKDIKGTEIIFHNEDIESEKKPLYSFPDVYSEVHYLMNSICNEIDSGTDINDIYICGADEDYFNLLMDFGNIYKIGFDIPQTFTLLETPLARDFIKFFKEGGLDFALEKTAKYYEINPNLNTVLENGKKFFVESLKEIDQINLYRDVFASYKSVHESKINAVRLLNGYFAPENSKIFYIGCGLYNAPKRATDTDYLSDKEKEEVGVSTSYELNDISMKEITKLIKSNNLIYCSKSSSTKARGFVWDPPLLSMGLLEAQAAPKLEFDYGVDFKKYWATHLIDEQYGLCKTSKLLKQLKEDTKLSHRMYENGYKFVPFKWISDEEDIEYSYTSVEQFSECSFKFYCDHILKLGEFEPNFPSNIGNICHNTLEKVINGEDFEKSWDQSVANEEPRTKDEKYSFKDLFFLSLIKKELLDFINFLQAYEQNIVNREDITEREFKAKLAEHIFVTGRVDKIILSGENKQYITIVDYKKKNHGQYDEKLISRGFCLQLPFYVYLIRNGVDIKKESYSDKEIIALFIHQILPSDRKDKPFYNQKLDGVFVDEGDKINSLGTLNDRSPIIKGSKNGKGYRGKKKDLFDDFEKTVKEKIISTDEAIRKGEFFINPKKKGENLNPCKYCSYRSICFRRELQVIEIEEDEEEKTNEA